MLLTNSHGATAACTRQCPSLVAACTCYGVPRDLSGAVASLVYFPVTLQTGRNVRPDYSVLHLTRTHPIDYRYQTAPPPSHLLASPWDSTLVAPGISVFQIWLASWSHPRLDRRSTRTSAKASSGLSFHKVTLLVSRYFHLKQRGLTVLFLRLKSRPSTCSHILSAIDRACSFAR